MYNIQNKYGGVYYEYKSELIATKVDIELKEAFVAIARNKHRPASQILRDLIRVYVESNQTQPNEKH